MIPGPSSWPVDDPIDRWGEDVLRERTRSTPDRTAIVDADTGDRWTYAEFDDRVDERADRLSTVLPGQTGRVGALVSTSVAFAELVFATWRLNRSLVPLDVRSDDETVADAVERAGVDALVCEASTERTAREATSDEVSVSSIDEPVSNAGQSVEETIGPETDVPARSGDRGGEHLVIFTSGTTGRPNGVRLTNGTLAASANASAGRLGVVPGDRWLVCLPMSHTGGLAPLVRSTLYGTTTVIQSAFDATATARAMVERDVTCVSLVPTMLTRLLDAGWTPPDGLRFALLGGGPASPSLVERCERCSVPVCPTYGATETASQVATALPETAFEKPGTVGPPLEGVDVTVVDGDGNARDRGSVGEIVVDGPVVTPGYLDDDATETAFDDDGFHTGDRGYRDGDGNVWIEGRLDDVVVTGGENVRPSVVADAVREHGSVDDAVVVGVPDEEWGERVAALVVASDATLDAGDVRDHCRGRLANYEVPKTVAFVDDLPRTASGTVDRDRARDLLGDVGRDV